MREEIEFSFEYMFYEVFIRCLSGSVDYVI